MTIQEHTLVAPLTKQCLGLLLVCAVVSLGAWTSYAQVAEPRAKEKNVGAAVLLAIDPIPADCLFYGGKKKTAYWNLGLGLAGAGLIAGGAAGVATCDSADLGCIGWAIPISIGIAVYASSLIWDAVGGLLAVKRHNRELAKKKATGLRSLRPTVAYTGDGFMGGILMQF